MHSSVVPMVIANLTSTGCALLLTRRGPSPRLRLLTLTVGMMSLAQTTNFLYTQGVWSGGELYMQHIHHALMAGFSLLAMYLLGKEILDRNITDRRLRLAEHEVPLAEDRPSMPARTVVTVQTPHLVSPSDTEFSLLAGHSASPLPEPHKGSLRLFQPPAVTAEVASYEPTDRRQLHANSVQASLDLLALLQQVTDSSSVDKHYDERLVVKPQLVRA